MFSARFFGSWFFEARFWDATGAALAATVVPISATVAISVGAVDLNISAGTVTVTTRVAG